MRAEGRWGGRASRLAHLMLAIASVVVAIGVVEVALRQIEGGDDLAGLAAPLPWTRDQHDVEGLFTEDPRFGFRPVLGNGVYDDYGTLVNEYDPHSAAGRRRVLFLGDSVTARGAIVDGLRRVYGDAGYEYWNAGVESFNTVQEVEFYRVYNAPLRPDEVVLTFHLNDFQATPIAFRDDTGRLVAFAPHRPMRGIEAALFAHSRLYRRLLLALGGDEGDPDAEASEIERALLRLRRALEGEGARLTVIVLPYLASPDAWKPHQSQRHERILSLLRRHEIRHFDLLPALERGLARGIPVQEKPGDTWHPSRAIGRLFAEDLSSRGLLAPSGS